LKTNMSGEQESIKKKDGVGKEVVINLPGKSQRKFGKYPTKKEKKIQTSGERGNNKGLLKRF